MVDELTDEVVADHTVVVITSHDVMNKPDMIRWNEFCRGFTIDSLLKLASARSTNSGKKFTLLDFYVSMVVNREEEDLLLLGTDLIGLDAASRLSNAQVTERISVHLCTCLYACIWGCVLIRLNLCSGIVGWGAA